MIQKYCKLDDECTQILKNACFEASYDELIVADGIKTSKRFRIGNARIESFIKQREDKDLWNHAERILRSSEELKITLTVREDSAYPDRFRNNKDMSVLNTFFDDRYAVRLQFVHIPELMFTVS